MKFFIDTANLAQITEANDLGILDGVTTNPSLMAKEGIAGEAAILKHYVDICNMIAEGEKLAALHQNIVVKIPMIKDWIKAIKYFSSKGIRTNCTLIFSSGQAILAAKAGATYISPFVGRLDDISYDGMQLIAEISQIFAVQGYQTQILAASIRNPIHIIKSAQYGAHVITSPLSAILALLNHPLTDKGLAQFLADHKKANS